MTDSFWYPSVEDVLDIHEDIASEYPVYMAMEEKTGERTPLDDVMEDIRRELVLRVAKADRDGHREIYDALENE